MQIQRSCLIRLAVRTPRCGRGTPGSNPGLDIFLDVLIRPFQREEFGILQVTPPPAYTSVSARLAQSVERQPFKLVVVGSSPTVGVFQ